MSLDIPADHFLDSNWENVTDNFDDMNLKRDLLKGIYNYGFIAPSKIQSLGIEPIVLGRDTIAQAQSGTGKTATFAIAILQRLEITETGPAVPQAMILAPTRELANQSTRVMTGIGKLMGVQVHACIGGTPVANDIAALRKGVHVIVGTPGRVLDMIGRGELDPKSMRMWCLDEADEMLSRGFTDQIYQIFQEMHPEVQVILISATMPAEVLGVTEKFMRDPIRILVKRDELTLDGIRQFYINCSREDYKFETLLDLYKTISVHQAVIFCNT
ncbi:hypothetical protein KIPB_011976, partial [Kipferlia bialata]|eukprot:g11976.t1